MNDDDCYLFDCLPVSGARYVNDLKGLRMKMKMLQEDYHRVFVHLGSNDVLCPLDVFYRNVTEMVDVIHEKTSSTIYLGEIPPRDLDRRRSARTTPEKIWKYRRKTYASIVKEMPAVVTVFDECCSSDHMELKSCPRVAKKRFRKVRYFRRRSSRHARKLGKMV
ncbi:hypothetical protein ACF0H5_002227 [Mactra antiquata]